MSAGILAQPLADFSSVLARFWTSIGLYGRIAVVGVLLLFVAWLVGLGLKRLGRGGRRGLLWGLTGLCCIGLIVFGVWAARLPVARGSYFVLWHQLVRVGAALCGTGFVIGFMVLVMPRVLDRIEGRGFVAFVAARHVRASKSGFLTVISVLSIAGVMVSSFALCIVVSIMGGFGADLKRKILGNNAHMKVEAPNAGGFEHWLSLLDEVRLVQGVRAATPVVAGEAMASSSSNTAGVLVRGVDPVTIGTVIDLVQNIEIGKFEYLDNTKVLANLPADTPIGIAADGSVYLKGPNLRPFFSTKLDKEVEDAVVLPDQHPGLIIGRELAKTLHVYVGDEVTLVSPLGDLGPMGVLPRSRRFRVAAIFYSGMYEYDASHAYMKLDVAQEFLDLKQNISGIEIKLENAERVAPIRPVLSQAIQGTDLVVRDWQESNKNLFSALKLEKIATFIILSIAIAVASFCIICTLLLMLTEKSKEIAILKALGSSDRAITRIFMTEGVMIGAIGTVFGVVTGLVLTVAL
ncbi:MAG TPA: ABC transporter permease, partial [Polyangiaceae bacterium]|nr:ABC transporter permease [Polyangiaceae bacterium]